MSTSPEVAGGCLSVVATPIGNLEDITLRALRILREADLVLAEDTRVTRKLFARHGIDTALAAFHAHSSDAQVEGFVERMRHGARFALVSDAGTPLVSDPGQRLVSACRDAGVRVEPLPGPSAVLAALTTAGLPASPFRFVGFIARSGKRRREALEQIARDAGATVLFESPRRLRATLGDLAEALPDGRRVAVCRELTKKHEETLVETPAALLEAMPEEILGEIALVIEGRPAHDEDDEAGPSDDALRSLVATARAQGLKPSKVAKEIAAATGLSRSEAYEKMRALDEEAPT